MSLCLGPCKDRQKNVKLKTIVKRVIILNKSRELQQQNTSGSIVYDVKDINYFCRWLSLLVTIAFQFNSLCGQEVTLAENCRVGLVLSGGGAKGIAHIGLIQALEENEIPIDYITGTSIGAVVGSLYAIGMSPAEMYKMVLSSEFRMWQSGLIDESFREYYKEIPPTPNAFRLHLPMEKSRGQKNFFFPRTSLVDPSAQKIGMLEVYGANVFRSRLSFDSLFVPLRVVASDIARDIPIVLERGELDEAVRASMAFPFIFQPVMMNGRLLYDGGIYNNFPVDVMIDTFCPDFIIGSVVSGAPKSPQEGDLRGQLENMITQHTDYDVPDSIGVRIRISLPGISLLDFDKAPEIYSIGYAQGLAMADSILKRVGRRVSEKQVQRLRANYKGRVPQLDIKKMDIEGLSSSQKKYISSYISTTQLSVLKNGLYTLASDDKITELNISLCQQSSALTPLDSIGQMYGRLRVRMGKSLQLNIGGLITSPDYNRLYFGILYRTINKVATSLLFNLQLGHLYSSISGEVRTEIPAELPFVSSFRFNWMLRRYARSNILPFCGISMSRLKQEDLFASWQLSFPWTRRGKIEASVGYGFWDDRAQSKMISEACRQNWLRCLLAIKRCKMSETPYPDRGYRWDVGWKGYFGDRESWHQFSASCEKYFRFSDFFILGTTAKFLWSDYPHSKSYLVSQARQPEFVPYGYMMQIYNAWLHADSYVAVGVEPIFSPYRKLQIRFSSMLMSPISNRSTRFDFCSKQLRKNHELTLLYKTPIADLAAFSNLFWVNKQEWNFGIRIGFLLNEDPF